MNRRRRHPLRSTALPLLVGLAMLASLVGSATSARAQDDPINDNADGGNVQGNTYTSPDLGYAISWDRTWDSTDDVVESNPDTYNGLTLANGTSTVLVEGAGVAIDGVDCIANIVGGVEGDPSASNVEQVEDDLSADVPSALYTFDYGDAGESMSLAMYVQCQPILEGEAVLDVVHITLVADYEDQIMEREDLLANLALDGDLPEVDAD